MGSCWFYRSALGLILFSDNIKLVFLQIFDYRQNRHKPKLKLAESQLTQNNQSFFGGELLNQTDSDPLRFQIAQSQRKKVEISGHSIYNFRIQTDPNPICDPLFVCLFHCLTSS